MDRQGSRRRSPSYSSDREDERRRRRKEKRDYRDPYRSESERGYGKEHRDHRDPCRSEGQRRPREDRDERSRNDRRRHRSGSPVFDHTRQRRHDYDSEDRPAKRLRSSSQSPRRRHSKASPSPPQAVTKRSRVPLAPQESAYKNENGELEKAPDVEKQAPNFSNTGKLAADTNTVAGTNIVLKYNEPPEARKPPARDAWRLYVFKGSDLLETVELGGRSCWLVGRERLVVDFPVDHPSCSKQHAVLQFRHVVKTNEFGDKDARVRLVGAYVVG